MDGSALYSDVCEIGIHGTQLAGKATAEALRHAGALLTHLTITMGLRCLFRVPPAGRKD